VGVEELFGPEKYDLFMVEEEDAEGEDARGGPRVSFKLFRKEVRVLSTRVPSKVERG
jgi:hypothetical protein